MAAYNYGHYIKEAIFSVKEQTFCDWELIVVDDGSTDKTGEIVSGFLGDPRIRYQRQENQGQPAAVNAGVALARAEWIAFLDADDRWMPDKLAKQFALVQERPQVSVIYAERLLMDPNGEALPTPRRLQFRGNIMKELFRQNPIPFSSAMVKRSVIQEVGRFNIEYRHANDYDLWLRIAARKLEFDYVPEPLIWYRTGHANLTSIGDAQLTTALAIMDRFVATNPSLLSRRWRSICYSETYLHLGMVFADRNVFRRAAHCYLRAVLWQPSNFAAWGMLAWLFLPNPLVRCVKSLFLGERHA